MNKFFFLLFSALLALPATAQSAAGEGRRRPHREAFQTDTLMVHDPVMAHENGLYYVLSTGNGLQWATSPDRRTWTVQPTPFIRQLPAWTRDSVPGFRSHVWAPDVLRWNDRWWLAYSCSTFGRNTSAIGLMCAPTLGGEWQDLGCVVRSQEGRDNWNAIDPCLFTDDDGQPWMAWGSFWDGIQLAPLNLSPQTSHLSPLTSHLTPQTIARRHRPGDPTAAENPTSQHAGRNAIEAPFVFRHDGWYYLFVSWDYCCRGAKSNYRVAVGRSRSATGPYIDREGRPMLQGGGTVVFLGDGHTFEAAGHCAVYHLEQEDADLFICHGYSTALGGQSILVQRTISWTPDGWPEIE